MTVADLILRALQDLELVGGGGDVGDPDDVQLAFDRLNDFVDDLQNEGLLVYSFTRTTWTITSLTASYTVGIGGTVNVDRPLSPADVANVGYVDTNVTPSFEVLLGPPLTEDAYQGIPFKAMTGIIPAAFYYNPTLPVGTLKPFPIPTSSTLLGVIYTPVVVSEFTSIFNTIVVPSGYRRFFRNQLTIEIASAFGRTPPPAVVEAARDSRAKIKRTNERLVDISFDVALTGGGRGGNIYTGE